MKSNSKLLQPSDVATNVNTTWNELGQFEQSFQLSWECLLCACTHFVQFDDNCLRGDFGRERELQGASNSMMRFILIPVHVESNTCLTAAASCCNCCNCPRPVICSRDCSQLHEVIIADRCARQASAVGGLQHFTASCNSRKILSQRVLSPPPSPS